ncbi:EPOXIDE HYDROLASE 4-LIKE [Salix viminalis]|uniref:EPOXIDE HYDROLASE 4-LIKE n=1 Tax=Salix viminalis TaxID=40686 RepID=A0A9Q0TBB4_SALVM|nr:EPOXIDE HYDROLASE 4-LIKE [Salix viminalis]
MVNTWSLYKPLLHGLLKLAGMNRRVVEIESGTTINFWVPSDETTSKKKPAVVFLHGFGSDGILAWQFQVFALANKYAVYVPDLLFFGDSTTDKSDRSPAFQAECMAEGLWKLGVEKCTLVGLSYGGMVGFKMAEMYPNLVKSMVITCSVMALTESITRDGLQRIGCPSWPQYLIPETVEGVKTLLDVAFYKLPWIPNFIYKDILEAMYSDHRKERHELLEDLIVKDKNFTAPHFTQRIHLLWGGEDIIFDKTEVRNLMELLQGKATLHCIERAGHLVELERPFVYNRQLKKILASLHEDGKEN